MCACVRACVRACAYLYCSTQISHPTAQVREARKKRGERGREREREGERGRERERVIDRGEG